MKESVETSARVEPSGRMMKGGVHTGSISSGGDEPAWLISRFHATAWLVFFLFAPRLKYSTIQALFASTNTRYLRLLILLLGISQQTFLFCLYCNVVHDSQLPTG
jgi:hypothetical protein